MRLPDWQARMMAAIEQAKAHTFQWGEHDCCLFAAHVLDAMTDDNYSGRLRERFAYGSEYGALRIIRSGGGLRLLVNEFLGQPALPHGQAAQGDLVLINDFAEQEVLGICEGSQAICAGAYGAVPLPMARAICCWKIS